MSKIGIFSKFTGVNETNDINNSDDINSNVTSYEYDNLSVAGIAVVYDRRGMTYDDNIDPILLQKMKPFLANLKKYYGKIFSIVYIIEVHNINILNLKIKISY